MSINESQYAGSFNVASAAAEEREVFYKKTYLHLAGALLALIGLEAILLKSSFAPLIAGKMAGSNLSWGIVLVAFMAVSYVANKWAHSNTSQGIQYLGLMLYVVAEAFILLPILYVASTVPAYADKNVIAIAGMITLFLFLALTIIAFFSKADFSFMSGFLKLCGIIAVGAIGASLIFKFTLGIWFSAAMCIFMGGYILYTTSKIIHDYNPKQYVAASLSLFASIATLFFYVLRIVMSFTNRD